MCEEFWPSLSLEALGLLCVKLADCAAVGGHRRATHVTRTALGSEGRTDSGRNGYTSRRVYTNTVRKYYGCHRRESGANCRAERPGRQKTFAHFSFGGKRWWLKERKREEKGLHWQPRV